MLLLLFHLIYQVKQQHLGLAGALMTLRVAVQKDNLLKLTLELKL